MHDKERINVRRLFVLAEAISTRVAYVLSPADKSMVMQPWDAYPELFAEDKEAYEKALYEEQIEAYKQARKAQAERLAGGNNGRT